MVDLLSCFRKKGHPIWLYPGLSPVVDLEVASDAAGSLGFGAYFKGF